MAISASSLQSILSADASDAWVTMVDKVWEIMSAPIESTTPDLEVAGRDREVGKLDNALIASWELWNDFNTSVKKGASLTREIWRSEPSAKALLILDALSLREVPWILSEAKKRGYAVELKRATASELPSDTTQFAKALGFSQRSALAEGQTKKDRPLSEAKTFSCDLPWSDCQNLIGSERNLVFWHHWPDSRVHDLKTPGDGFQRLTRESQEQLTSNAFWDFIERLTTGRKLIITSDHGYAVPGLFADVTEKDQANYLKKNYGSQRYRTVTQDIANWAPPLEIELNGQSGRSCFVLGRRKWKSAGGYPTLAHGGLSLLEILTPFVVLSR